jgi:hypothetical protein
LTHDWLRLSLPAAGDFARQDLFPTIR